MHVPILTGIQNGRISLQKSCGILIPIPILTGAQNGRISRRKDSVLQLKNVLFEASFP